MFSKNKFLILFAAAALVAACGGGGSGSDSPAPTAPGTGSNTGGSGDDGGTTVTDQKLRGYLQIAGNQIVYVRILRDMYLPVWVQRFEGTNGINDVAPGYTGNEPPPPYYGGADGGDYAPAQTLGPAAPMAAFGIRVFKPVQRTAPTEAVANQTAVSRLAMELVERNTSPYLEGGVPEIMRFVMNDVELSTDANGEISARVLPNAQMHVYGRNRSGTEVRATVPLRTDAVSILPMNRVPDHYGDESSVVLLFDLEKAFSQAGESLNALQAIRGHFDMHVTMSGADLVLPACVNSSGSAPRRDMVGRAIQVNDQPAVSGGGLSGYAWIRSYDPNPLPDDGYNEAGGAEAPCGSGTGGTPAAGTGGA